MAKPADAKPSKSRKPKASTEASIKAEAVAKAIISRERKIKHTINEVIPEDVTRENAASWRDMLSPFRETALLAAGWVRQFRLKQDRTLTEIADRAEKRRNNAIHLHSVPAKFLIPFVEAASLEEEDSPLVDMWANLLVSASEDYDENMIHFVGLLSRMGARQAKVFAGSLGTGTIDDVERACDTASFTVNERSLRQTMLDSIEKTKAENLDDLVSALLEVLDNPILTLVFCAAETVGEDDYSDFFTHQLYYKDNMEVDFAILQALGLLTQVSTDLENYGKFNIRLIYFLLTPLGLHFVKACRILPS